MIKKISNEKYIKYLAGLCTAVYFVSYVTRINYAAVLVEIIQSEGMLKTQASIPLTALFIFYGFGQLISGYMGDRFRPERLITSGLLLTSAMNIMLPLSQNYLWMTMVWSVNGFAQALMWPPITKILTTYLTQENYKKQVAYVTYGSHFGTMTVYFTAPLIIQIAGWKMIFFVAAGLAFLMVFLWNKWIYRIEEYAEYVETKESKDSKPEAATYLPFTGVAVWLLICIMVTNIPQGILRDGVSSWMPNFITDVFHIESSISILTGVAIPVFSIGITYLTSYINRKLIKNEAVCTTLFFSICIISNLLLCTIGKNIPVLSVISLLFMNAMANGINFMYTGLAVANFERYNKTSFVTGAINSAVYIGSAISMYGIAYITERFGWDITLWAWCAVGILGLMISICSIPLFRKIKNN